MANFSFGQRDSVSFNPSSSGMYPKEWQKALGSVSVGGFYRFIGNYTVMKEQYPEMSDFQRRVFLGDDSQLPQLSLNIGLSPSRNTSISTDLYMWTPMTGSETDYVQGLQLGVNLNGQHATRYGTFSVKTGGIHWYRLSGMTFGTNTGYNRFSLFERNPWDPNTADPFERYQTYYDNGALTQDVRWGQQAFQGIILDGVELPKEFSFAFMHGKSQLNGGFAPLPNHMTAGKIQKDFKNQMVSLNYIHSKTFADSTAKANIGFNMLTSAFELKWPDILTFSGEIGIGNYFSPTSTGAIGEAIDVKINFPKSLTRIPFEVRYFQISPNVINNNGIFWNTSINEYSPQTEVENTQGQTPLLFPFASSQTTVGALTNNRRGVILNADLELGKQQKLTIGYSSAAEIVGVSNIITYGHPANNLALSRFWRWGFPPNVGPYGNINKIYRGVYESMNLTDSLYAAKGFNSVELSYKSSFKLFGKRMMVFYLGGFHTVQPKWTFYPQFSEKSYLQAYTNQLEAYYGISKSVVLSAYLGYDRFFANADTELDVVTGKARNQEGVSYAFGLDFQMSKNTGLYIRQRWMTYRDFSFELDRYRGMETTVELKIYF